MMRKVAHAITGNTSNQSSRQTCQCPVQDGGMVQLLCDECVNAIMERHKDGAPDIGNDDDVWIHVGDDVLIHVGNRQVPARQDAMTATIQQYFSKWDSGVAVALIRQDVLVDVLGDLLEAESSDDKWMQAPTYEEFLAIWRVDGAGVFRSWVEVKDLLQAMIDGDGPSVHLIAQWLTIPKLQRLGPEKLDEALIRP